MKSYHITVPRFEQGQKDDTHQTYSFELEDHLTFSILDGLEYIYQHLDPTLAFYHHAACLQAACGKCMVRANGKPVLACKQKLEPGGLLLEPFGKEVVKDLVAKT